MSGKIMVSGFADEIDSDFTVQLKTVTGLGMNYISLRSANGRGIAEYTVDEVSEQLLPVLRRFGVKVSSLGSPIGKIRVDDEAGFARQLGELDTLCQIGRLLDCRYIRMFSFYIPDGAAPEQYRDVVVSKLKQFIDVADSYDIVLIHENEKEIYGDTAKRCRELMDALPHPCFRSVFDFANFVQCGEDPLACWELLKDTVSYIHIKDAVAAEQENVLCGSGEGRIREILNLAVNRDGYKGFLTLEPHLVLFDSLKSLETAAAETIIKVNKARDGAEAYAMQFHALRLMLEEIMMEKKIRFGLIGIGAQGSAYAGFLTGKSGFPGMPAPECPPHCALGALCDIDPAKESMCREQYSEVPFYNDWKEMVASGDVDAVITTVPHYLHTEIAIYCLEHGMNVLVEKPAGVYAKEVQRMNECAAAHPDAAFGIMFNQRTNKLYQQIKELVASGELGQIRRSHWMINSWWRPDSYYRQSDWRATWGGEGGGVLVNQAPHQLDLWQWLCGVPSKVYAKCLYGCHRDIVVENDVTVVAEYENGATGSFITCTHDPIGTDRLEIDLDNGKIVVEDSKKATIWRLKKSENEMNDTMSMMEVARLTMGNSAGADGLYTVETIENSDGWGVQHVMVMVNFALHVLTGSPLLAPGSDGINGVNLANAILLSSWLGREVENPVDQDMYLAELNKKIADEGKFPRRAE